MGVLVTLARVTVMVDNDELASRFPARLRWRHGVAWKRRLQWVLGGLFVMAYVVGREATRHHLAFGIALGCVCLVWLVTSSVVKRPGVRATERRQPGLVNLVHEVASFGGLRPPNRIWLTPDASVEARGRLGRRELLVGWAAVLGLSKAELRALVARELMILQFRWPRVVPELTRRWYAAAALATLRPPKKRWVRLESDLRPMAQLVLSAADVAATNIAGRDVAARAFVVNFLQDSEFDDFVNATTSGAPRRWWRNPGYFVDLYDVWPRWLAHCDAFVLDGPDGEKLLELFDLAHPGLAEAARGLWDQPIDLNPTATPVRIVAPTRGQQRFLIRRLRKLNLNFYRWYTYSAAPTVWWSNRAKAEADSVRSDVAALLGRPPVDAFESAEVLITRNPEIMALWKIKTDEDADPSTADPSDYGPPPILCGVVEDALLPRGWHLEHPAIRGVLIGPRGERLDVTRSVTRTAAGFDLEALRSVLRPDPSWVGDAGVVAQ